MNEIFSKITNTRFDDKRGHDEAGMACGKALKAAHLLCQGGLVRMLKLLQHTENTFEDDHRRAIIFRLQRVKRANLIHHTTPFTVV